ncbi:MAG: hypothetical protein R6V13_03090 [Anaerolineae bacterium]
MRDDFEEHATRAIISYAFFRWESALTIGATILLLFFLPTPFPWWRWWYWLVLGTIFEALIVYTSITDEETNRQVVAAVLRERYRPGNIRTEKYKEQLKRALEYRERIEANIAATPPGLLRDQLYGDTRGIADWLEHIYTVIQRLDAYERNEILHKDRREIPAQIERLQKALDREDDANVQDQIQKTLSTQKGHLQELYDLENIMEEAQFRVEETVSSLGTIYSQLQRIRAQKMSRSRIEHLTTDIDEQIQRLEDILESMNRIYGRL